MNEAPRPKSYWRLRSNSFSSVVSTMLVLYALGVLSLLLINVQRLSEFAKENLTLSLVMVDQVKRVDAEYLRQTLEAAPYTKSTHYISQEQAAQELQESLGQDFLTLLGYNPLHASIELRLRSPWANNDSIAKIADKLSEAPQVTDVRYEANLVELVNANIRKLGGLVLAFGVLMSFIAVVLINSTMRLSIYARRFTIRTMQLVGATRRFIRRPFIAQALWHGLLSAGLAILLLLYTVWLLQRDFYDLINLHQYPQLGVMALFVLLAGVAINMITTYFAVNKYLNIATDALYY